jgi:hypothetical protein
VASKRTKKLSQIALYTVNAAIYFSLHMIHSAIQIGMQTIQAGIDCGKPRIDQLERELLNRIPAKIVTITTANPMISFIGFPFL